MLRLQWNPNFLDLTCFNLLIRKPKVVFLFAGKHTDCNFTPDFYLTFWNNFCFPSFEKLGFHCIQLVYSHTDLLKPEKAAMAIYRSYESRAPYMLKFILGISVSQQKAFEFVIWTVLRNFMARPKHGREGGCCKFIGSILKFKNHYHLHSYIEKSA